MKNSTDTSSPSVTGWWFPNLPNQDKLAALAVHLPKGKQNPEAEEYPELLASRIEALASKESPERVQELAEDAGLEPEALGFQVVEQSALVEQVVASLADGQPGLPKLRGRPLVPVVEEMSLEGILADLT